MENLNEKVRRPIRTPLRPLTDELIESFPVAHRHRPIVLRDSELKEFGVKISSRTKVFFVEIRKHGKKVRVMIANQKSICTEEARVRARKILKEKQSNHKNKTEDITLGEVLEEYLRVRSNLRPSSQRAYRMVSRQRLEDWLSLPIKQITRQMVEQRHREISTVSGKYKASKVQANFAMRILRLLLNFAAEHYASKDDEPFLLMNPVRTLSRNNCWHRIPERQSIIPDHQLARWYSAVTKVCSSTVRDYLLFVLFTGLRKMEAMTLKWTDIDFGSRVLTVTSEKTKNHREHRLPLSPYLYNLLKRRKARSKSEWVFPGKGKKEHLVQVAYMLDIIREKSGIPFSPHDLRRTFLTTAEKLNLPFYVLKRLANHSARNDVTFGYIIIDVERLREPMQKISERLLLKLLVEEQP